MDDNSLFLFHAIERKQMNLKEIRDAYLKKANQEKEITRDLLYDYILDIIYDTEKLIKEMIKKYAELSR